MDEQFESQFTGSPLAEDMGKAYQNSKEYYLEYVTEDHNHEIVSRISRSTALAMVKSSPYRRLLKSPFQIQLASDPNLENWRVTGLMNKGAVRITPSEYMMRTIALAQRTPDSHRNGWHPHKNDWVDASPYEFGEGYRNEIWVYNHDGKYYITRPRKDV